MQVIISLVLTTIAVGTALLFPLIHLILVGFNFIAHSTVLGLQLVLSRFPVKVKPASIAVAVSDEPFVSIHVPTHNEPPQVVWETLSSLAQLDWENFEVLVIDNNTADPKLWTPIRDYCKVLGPKFRFFHVEGLSGFKAGAMNHVRQFMNPAASFIFVVDADYVVEPRALRTAVPYLKDDRIGLVQFPQDYRNIGRANLGIALDYKHFFTGFMNVANALECVPSSGTLALINVKALQAIGGFDGEFVTEDAQLGLNLVLNGYRCVYVNQTIGAGLLPHELDGLKNQRWRWAFGNAQILRRRWHELFFASDLSWKQKLGFLSHLTAWFNFNLIPSLSLILLAFYSLTDDLEISQIYSIVLSGFTLCTYFFLKYGVLHYSLRREGHSLSDIWKAFGSHVGLGWIFSASWIRCLFNSSSPFVRTNKFIASVVPGLLKTTLIELALGIGLISAAVILAWTDFILGPVAAIVTCGAAVMIYWVWSQTKHTFIATTRLFPAVDETPIEEDKAA